ncbi:short chain dehydrogenase, partial [Streptomyces sp. SolWspMP-sol7th]
MPPLDGVVGEPAALKPRTSSAIAALPRAAGVWGEWAKTPSAAKVAARRKAIMTTAAPHTRPGEAGTTRGPALVTGATRGIGLAVAEALVARGYPVVARARDAEAVARTVKEPAAGGARVEGVVTDAASVHEYVATQWPARLPHVSSVAFTTTPATPLTAGAEVQHLEMETHADDGTRHLTRSIRLGFATLGLPLLGQVRGVPPGVGGERGRPRGRGAARPEAQDGLGESPEAAFGAAVGRGHEVAGEARRHDARDDFPGETPLLLTAARVPGRERGER